MRIAVTGGMGFIGSELVYKLLADKTKTVAIVDRWQDRLLADETCEHDILEQNYYNLSKCYTQFDPAEFLRKGSIDFAPDVIVHAGACVDTTEMTGYVFEENVNYTRDLVVAFPKAAIVFLSSYSVYGTTLFPNNPYGLSKSLAEKFVNRSNMGSSILRLVNVFGKREAHKDKMISLPYKIADAYKRGAQVHIWGMDTVERDFVPVDNVVEVIQQEAELIRGKHVKRVHDVGTGSPTKLSDLDNFIMQATGHANSLAVPCEMPPWFKGHYQTYSKAGSQIDVLRGTLTTREGIEKYYGK